MKFSFGNTQALACLTSLTSLVAWTTANPEGCVSSADAGSDLFPHKVQPTASEFWNVTYYGTYKIVENKAAAETYLLYQCGTDIPTSEVGKHNQTVPIPVTKIGVALTNTIAFLEQLNKVDDVVAYTGDVQYISSPCMLEAIAQDEVYVLRNRSQREDFAAANAAVDAELNGTVAFNSPWDFDHPFDNNIVTSTERELTNAAIFEWIKFYATFFNLEEMANEAFEAAEDRSECVSSNAQKFVSDATKPVVFWAYYSDFCEGWALGVCPNYYCEFAAECSAELVLADEEGTLTHPDCGTAKYYTIEQVMEYGKDADHWIFPGPNWEGTYDLFKTELDQFKSVQSKQVYDYQGSGENAWFEQRYAEYYDVLQDFCSVVGTTSSLTGRGWFRNVLEPEPVGDLGQCSDATRTSILPYDFECALMDPNTDEQAPSTNNDNGDVGNNNGDVGSDNGDGGNDNGNSGNDNGDDGNDSGDDSSGSTLGVLSAMVGALAALLL